MAITLDGTNGVTTPDLTVDTNTLKVDAANNRVGIGNASPNDVLHIKRTDGTTAGNVLNIDNSAGSSTHGAVTNGIRVVSDNNGYWANLRVQGHSTLFDPQGSGTKVRIDADGLKFGTDTAAVNALDDYEEGTWTPVQSNATTMYSQVGRYTKIGNMVHVQAQFDFTQSGTTFGVTSGFPYVVTDLNYVPIVFREWYSTGHILLTSLTVGGQSTSNYRDESNVTTAVNGQRYGFAISVSYRT